MPSLIPNSQLVTLTGALMNLFDTVKRPIIVFKEPIQTINSTSDNTFAGYGSSSEEANITYTPVSGAFYAMKCDPFVKPGTSSVPLTTNVILENKIRIKVLPEAMSYIAQGKTEAILYDGILFKQVSKPMPQNYLGLQFYHFDINQIE